MDKNRIVDNLTRTFPELAAEDDKYVSAWLDREHYWVEGDECFIRFRLNIQTRENVVDTAKEILVVDQWLKTVLPDVRRHIYHTDITFDEMVRLPVEKPKIVIYKVAVIH